MSYTVSQLKDSVGGMLSGTNLNNVTNLNGAIERSARQLAQKLGLLDTMGRQAVTLYDGVFDYTAPTSIFGTDIIDVAPQGNSRQITDYAYKGTPMDFDREKNYQMTGTKVTFEYSSGTPIMRVTSALTTARAVLDPMTDTSGWIAAGSASGLTQDSTVFYQDDASLRFQLAGASTGTLTKTISTQNLSSYEDVAVGFLALYAPSITNLTSVSVRLGSSASAYDTVTTTQGFLGAFTSGEWILLAFDFSGSSSTGTPNWSSLAYLQLRITHGGAMSNVRVGGFWLSLPTPVLMKYKTAALFRASGANPSTTITNDNDQIILQDSTYTLFEHEVSCEVLRQMGDASPALKDLEEKMYNPKNGLYTLYMADNPSQSIRTIGSWY